MKHTEKIPERIRAYLLGKLTEAEKLKMEKTLLENPTLRKEVAFSRLLMAGLNRHKKRRSKIRKYLMIGILTLIVLGIAIIMLGLRSRESKEMVKEKNPVIQVENPRSAFDHAPIRQAGGSKKGKFEEAGRGIDVNETGEIFVIGEYGEEANICGTLAKNQGNVDIFLIKYGIQGDCEWFRTFGSPYPDLVRGITLDKNNDLILTGSIGNNSIVLDTFINTVGLDNYGNRDFFIAKFSRDGQLLWIHHTGGRRIDYVQTGVNQGLSVAVDNDNNILALGAYIGHPKFQNGQTLPDGGPNSDLYLAKYDPYGKLIWLQKAIGNYEIVGFGVGHDALNDIYISGHFGHHNYSGKAYFKGETLTSYGGRDIFLAKYSSTGNLQWVKQAGSTIDSSGRDLVKAMVTDAHGNIYLTGVFSGNAKFDTYERHSNNDSQDIYIAKYDTNGSVQWVEKAGSEADKEYGTGIAIDNEGNSYITGNFSGSATFGDTTIISKGGSDAFVAKYRANGQFDWVYSFGGESMDVESDAGQSISVWNNEQLIITGFFSGIMSIGEYVVQSVGGQDIFILTLDLNGRPIDIDQRSVSI